MLIKPKHKNLINNFVSQQIIFIYIYKAKQNKN